MEVIKRENIAKRTYTRTHVHTHSEKRLSRALTYHVLIGIIFKTFPPPPSLFRYLVLYQYGGIYTDMDAAPGPKFENASVISDHDEAWFVVERIGIPSQYFMASTPQHPLMFLLVTVTLRRLLEVHNVGEQYVPYVTGPGALKEAWQHFMYHYPEENKEEEPVEEEPSGTFITATTQESTQDNLGEVERRRRLLENTTEVKMETDEPPTRRFGLEGGVYIGMLNWTVTIAGNRGVSIDYNSR
jgi:Glycosyltransferase sugar-binding region containing DXD motif